MVNDWKSEIVIASFIIDVWEGSKYVSAHKTWHYTGTKNDADMNVATLSNLV